jgi:hypothetical protein
MILALGNKLLSNGRFVALISKVRVQTHTWLVLGGKREAHLIVVKFSSLFPPPLPPLLSPLSLINDKQAQKHNGTMWPLLQQDNTECAPGVLEDKFVSLTLVLASLKLPLAK